MKEYLLGDLPTEVQNQMALGGIAGTVMVLLGTLVGTLHRPTPVRSAMLAGAITAPGWFRLLAGAVVAIVLVVLLQSANNAIFDPLFERPSVGVQHSTAP